MGEHRVGVGVAHQHRSVSLFAQSQGIQKSPKRAFHVHVYM